MEQDKRVYSIPRTDPLTFYISSISGLADGSERFLKRIISRRVEANTACYIEFRQGKAIIEPGLGNNPEEIRRIQGNIRDLVLNETFDLDSISVEAYASPEGLYKNNEQLSARRASSASEYFSNYAAHLRDSVDRAAGVKLALGTEDIEAESAPEISFRSRSGGENWRMLDALVEGDSWLPEHDKMRYKRFCESVSDPDRRERDISRLGGYKYMREKLYPRLRVVKFNFYLHRKGMAKDTVHTTELDTAYMRGVQCLRDHDYEQALSILRPYADYNTAVAYVATDRNRSALELLEKLPSSAGANYLLAIIYAREGDERLAVQHYIHACAQEPSYIHRGNLDPEISSLIRKYDLRLDNS